MLYGQSTLSYVSIVYIKNTADQTSYNYVTNPS